MRSLTLTDTEHALLLDALARQHRATKSGRVARLLHQAQRAPVVATDDQASASRNAVSDGKNNTRSSSDSSVQCTAAQTGS